MGNNAERYGEQTIHKQSVIGTGASRVGWRWNESRKQQSCRKEQTTGVYITWFVLGAV